MKVSITLNTGKYLVTVEDGNPDCAAEGMLKAQSKLFAVAPRQSRHQKKAQRKVEPKSEVQSGSQAQPSYKVVSKEG
jgi:hypothetical protein